MLIKFDERRFEGFLEIISLLPKGEQQLAVGDIPSEWATKMGLPAAVASGLPNARCDRGFVQQFCQGDTDYLAGYALAMAWGWQQKKNAVKALSNFEAVEAALKRLRHEPLDRSASYQVFSGESKIPGLGPSYFTKLIYFFSRSASGYIMDQWTGLSINYLTNHPVVKMSRPGRSGGMVSPMNTNTGSNYAEFCELLDQLAIAITDQLGSPCSGALAEQYLFSVGKKAPDGKKQAAGPWRAIVLAAHEAGVIPLT